MTGITIIAASTVVSVSALNFTAAYGCFLFLFVMCICAGIWRYFVNKVSYSRARKWVTLGLIVSATLGILFGKFIMPQPKEYTTIYKVELADDLNFGEFKENYIILKQEGKYYYIYEIDSVVKGELEWRD